MKNILSNNLRLMLLVLPLAVIGWSCSDDEDTGQYYQENLRDLTVKEYIENGANNTAGNAKYNILYSALEKAGMLDALDENVTLFAPSDAAFENAGIVLDDVSPETLQSILSYHVVAGDLESSAFSGYIPTAHGTSIYADGTCLNGVVTVTGTDINVGNGVIQAVNGVLMPPIGNLYDKLVDMNTQSGGDYSLLLASLDKSGYSDLLRSSDDFTLFAPTNAAFGAVGIDQSVIDALPAESWAYYMSYHVLSGVNYTCAIETSRVPTLAGPLNEIQGVDLVVDGAEIYVNESRFSNTNNVATNGVIQVVSDFIFAEPTIVEGLGPDVNITGQDAAAFDPFWAAVVRVGYDAGLLNDYEADYAVYAPCCSFDESAFSDSEIQELVDRHIFAGDLVLPAIASEGGTRFESLTGDKYVATTNNNGDYVNGTIRNAFSAGPTFPVYNGTLISLNGVLTPLPEETIVEQLKANPDYNLFATALEVTGVVDNGDYTVFALNNTVFLGETGISTPEEILALDDESIEVLTEILSTHVVQGFYYAVDIDDGFLPILSTISAENLVFSYLDDLKEDILILIDPQDISTAIELSALDVVTAANGVVHEVDGIISFE